MKEYAEIEAAGQTKKAKKAPSKRVAKKSKSPEKSRKSTETSAKATEPPKPKRARTKSPGTGLGPILTEVIPTEQEEAGPSDTPAPRLSTGAASLVVSKKTKELQEKTITVEDLGTEIEPCGTTKKISVEKIRKKRATSPDVARKRTKTETADEETEIEEEDDEDESDESEERPEKSKGKSKKRGSKGCKTVRKQPPPIRGGEIVPKVDKVVQMLNQAPKVGEHDAEATRVAADEEVFAQPHAEAPAAEGRKERKGPQYKKKFLTGLNKDERIALLNFPFIIQAIRADFHQFMNQNLTPEQIQFFTRAAKAISAHSDHRFIARRITIRVRMLIDPDFIYQCVPPYIRRTLNANEWNSLQALRKLAKSLGIDEKEIRRKATEMTVHGVIHDRLYLLIQLAELVPDLTAHIPALRRSLERKSASFRGQRH